MHTAALLLLALSAFRVPDVKAAAISRADDDACSTDDESTTKLCLNTYFSAFGIDSSQPLPPYEGFAKDTETVIYKFGVGGIDVICNYLTSLTVCLGALNKSPCLWTNSFMDMYAINATEAGLYAQDFPAREYVCTNKQELKDDFQCFKDVFENNLGEIQKCMIDKTNALNDGGEVCGIDATYVGCMEGVYTNHCSSSADIKSFVCNIVEASLTYDAPDLCKGKLPVCTAP